MIAIKVPPLGESIVEATISRWVKREGEAVSAGDTLVELETDKITVEVPAPSSGVLAKRLKAEGDVVAVDEALGEIDETGTAGAGAAAARTVRQQVRRRVPRGRVRRLRVPRLLPLPRHRLRRTPRSARRPPRSAWPRSVASTSRGSPARAAAAW